MGTCDFCGSDLIEVNYGGGDAQGRGAVKVWECPTHGGNYQKTN